MSVQSVLDRQAAARHCDSVWEKEILPQLTDYIRIPNKSPLFDPAWQEHGHMDRAVAQIESWCRGRAVRGLKVEVARLPGRTPLIFMEVPAFPDPNADSGPAALLYGHLDKQPEMSGWREDLGPWIPKREGDRLYGRGGADDGYSAFASLTAIEAVQKFGGSHRRLVIVIEGCEESGSPDLPHYIEHLAPRIGDVDLVICLDSGCGDYERLWSTTSLRGMIAGDLRVDVLTEGVHSGDASGVVPSSFRVLRQLLDRIEDATTGRILLEEFHVPIPAQRVEQARVAAEVLGEAVSGKFPFVPGVRAMAEERSERVLQRTWRPTLSVTGAGGFPALQDAGNVLRPFSALKLSLRLPPTANATRAAARLQQVLEADPPSGARISFKAEKGSSGWNAPALAPWLEQSVDGASRAFFGNAPAYMGEGGSIPFMGMLGEKFPAAQFLITGVLGPASNAHGPNEFLHVPTGKALTACVAQVLVDHSAEARVS